MDVHRPVTAIVRSAAVLPLLAAVPLLLAAEDAAMAPSWPNWRGPDCNGAVACGEPLVEDVTEAELAWQSDQRIPSGIGKGGYGSGYHDVTLAEGRAFHYWWRPAGPVDERVERALQWAERFPKMRTYLRKAAQDIPNRSRPLADDTVVAWDADDGETLWRATFAGEGLNTGHCSITYGIFSPQLVSCYADGILVNFSSSGRIRALWAADGKPLWEARLGHHGDLARMRLEDFARNRAYFAGGRNRFFGTGAKRDEPELTGMNSSGVIAGGVIAIADFQARGKGCGMIGIDLRTGEQLWRIPDVLNDVASMPLRWRHRGEEYLIAVNQHRGVCVEPRSGKILWEIAGDPLCAETYPAVHGDLLVTPGKGTYGRGKGDGTPMTCWKLSPEKAEPVWRAESGPKMGTFGGPVIDGTRVYYKAGNGVACRDLATGNPLGRAEGRRSNAAPVMCDDRLFVGQNMYLVAEDGALSPAGMLLEVGRKAKLGFSTDIADWTSATVCDGRLYYRTNDRVLCWDLLTEPREVPPRVAASAIADAAAALAALQARDLTTRSAGREWLLANPAQAAQALDGLSAAVTADDWQRASAAAAVLIALGSDAEAFAEQAGAAAREALAADDAAVARLLARVAVALDPAQREPLATAAAARVNADDLLAVQAACAVLGECGESSAVALPALTELVRGGRDRALEFAIEAFAGLGAEGGTCATLLIETILADPDSVRALFAARCLDALGPGAVDLGDDLLAAFCATSGPTRFWLSEVLTEIGPSAVEPLVAAAKAKNAERHDDALVLDVGKTCMNIGTEARAALPWLEAMQEEMSSKDGIQAHAKAWLIYCCDVVADRPVKLVSRNGKHKEGIALGDAHQAEALYRAKAAGRFKGKFMPIMFSPPDEVDE